VHHCIGAPLARTELRIALPALLRRFPSLALADPGAEIDFRSYNVVYGVRSLPVTW
jgi:cytochrome P450